MESLEAYQLDSGLTDHPLAFRIPPPVADTTILGTMLRDLATFQPALTITTHWQQPAASLPRRPNDRPISAYLTPALGTTLISINRLHTTKVRWVGDITNDKGTMLLSLESLRTKFGWSRHTLQRFAPRWDAIPTAVPPTPLPALRQQTLQWAPRPAGQPLPLPLPPPLRSSLPYLTHPLGRTFFVPTPGYETIHIPVHAMLVIPHHLTHQDGQPPTLSYRIRRRNSLQTRTPTSGTPQHRVKRAAATDWYPLPTVQSLLATSYPPAALNATSLFPGLTRTWSYMGRDGTTLAGTLQVHANHITPTRCELHSLLVGLHHSGDAALQICDNTKAIGLVVLARSLKRRGGLPRYSNIYRVELRSLMALFTDTGTFTGEWIRSHQDPADTPDPILRTKRTLLDEADSLVTLAHQLLPLTNYAHLIIPDYWELRDDHDRPVTGATAPWLGAVYGGEIGPRPKPGNRTPARPSSPSASPQGTIVNGTSLRSIFTGVPSYTLHTNARKHRIYPS
ncbi:hypothetical protein DYB38_009922 [Aphanomyces astaci]|uniref:Uncharacterized protein n=1 Tax=Aphanomyces astaci TaxID=112090 RepID=A0A397D5U5_APHAT|nr:hypothetical protein DYB38_009922 [Aphanomyces astaci]